MALRIVASILLLISVLYMPFWASLVILLGFIFYFTKYWEGVVIFLLMDLLYAASEAGFEYISFTIALTALIFIELLKRRLKFYPK